MPHVTLRDGDEDVRIYYHVYRSSSVVHDDPQSSHPRMLMIMGFAAPSVCWQPQLYDLLLHKNHDGSDVPIEICVVDNRGIGRSSSPADKNKYTTLIMANDANSVLDHLGWGAVHVVGFSMGGMVSIKFAATYPQRTASLTVISSTGGGWQIIPLSWRAICLFLASFKKRGPNAHHKLALKFHFRRDMLHETDEEDVNMRTRQAILLQEYVTMSEVLGEQSPDGARGQARACWWHRVTKDDIKIIRRTNFPVLVIHGRHDIVAMPYWGRNLAKRMHAPFVLLEGAHFLIRDQAVAVNQLIKGVVFGDAFHHKPHYQFVVSKNHLPGSYTEELDTSVKDLDEAGAGAGQNGGQHGGPVAASGSKTGAATDVAAAAFMADAAAPAAVANCDGCGSAGSGSGAEPMAAESQQQPGGAGQTMGLSERERHASQTALLAV